jgi:hypothetical protein
VRQSIIDNPARIIYSPFDAKSQCDEATFIESKLLHTKSIATKLEAPHQFKDPSLGCLSEFQLVGTKNLARIVTPILVSPVVSFPVVPPPGGMLDCEAAKRPWQSPTTSQPHNSPQKISKQPHALPSRQRTLTKQNICAIMRFPNWEKYLMTTTGKVHKRLA